MTAMPMMPPMEGPKKPAVAIAIGVGKSKPNSFTPPKGYASETDDEVKEALLKFKENPDGTCEMISLDGAPLKDNMKDKQEEVVETPEESGMEEEMPADATMEDKITAMQRKQQSSY